MNIVAHRKDWRSQAFAFITAFAPFLEQTARGNECEGDLSLVIDTERGYARGCSGAKDVPAR